MCRVRNNTKKSLELYFHWGLLLSLEWLSQTVLLMKSRNRTIWKHMMGKRFFSRWGYRLDSCWSNLMITENFSNSGAQFLLVGACGCAHSISCFQDDLSVLKACTLKVFKCPNKKGFLFEWQVYFLNSFVPFQNQIKQPCHIELHLSCSKVPEIHPCFFFLLWM